MQLNIRYLNNWQMIVVLGAVAYALPIYIFSVVNNSMQLIQVNTFFVFVYTVAMFVLFYWAAQRSKHFQPRLYPAWSMLTLSTLASLLLVFAWLVVELLWGTTDFFVMKSLSAMIPNGLFLWGILRIPRTHQTRLQCIRQVVDTVAIYVGVMLLLWIFWAEPLLRQNIASPNKLMFVALQLFVHLTLGIGLVLPINRPHPIQPPRPLLALYAALLLVLLADLAILLENPLQGYQPGSITNAIYLASIMVACIAAALQIADMETHSLTAEQPQKRRQRQNRTSYVGMLWIMLPTLMLFLVYVTIGFSDYALKTYPDYLMMIAVGLMFILVTVRQILTVLENVMLTSALRKELVEREQAQAELQHANETLEQHVQKRTNELLILNEQLRENEGKLRFDAFHDKLTGLPNRASFIHHLESALQVSQSDPTYRFAVLFFDFDGFKVVNDSLGHWLGDELLIALAHRLREEVPIGNQVARLGGDEFLVLLEHFADAQEPVRIAERIQRRLRQPLDICEYRLYTSASIGIVLNDEFHTTAGDILRDADIAMYRAKETGKARCVVFDQTMRAQAMQRLNLETALRGALSRNELYLAYQPIYDISAHKITGFEALARWQNEEYGAVAPSEFIPIAEETGLIISLGEWALEEACRQLKQWQADYVQAQELTVSVNISAQQLYQGDLFAVVKRTLEKTGLPAGSLKLEITESIFMEDVDVSLNAFSELREIGVQIQIDDFGTGYSSFNYLHRLPVDTLKIDRSFIELVQLGGQHLEIVRAIANLAHNLHLNVIAEGVETEEQLTYVQQLACEQVQGYLFSTPMSSTEVESSLAEQPIVMTGENFAFLEELELPMRQLP